MPYDASYVYDACNVLVKSNSKSIVATTHCIVLVKSTTGYTCHVHNFHIHIQIPPTGYVSLILRNTVVATASRSTVEGTIHSFFISIIHKKKHTLQTNS